MNLSTSTEPDDERDQKIQRNLIAYYRDEPNTGDNIRSATTNMPELDELLASIDESSLEAIGPKRPSMSEKLRKKIAAKLVEIEQYRKDNWQPYLEARRRQARQDYANERAAEGRRVRPYRRHPVLAGESSFDRELRLHREGSRRRAGNDETNTRSYLHLADMTEEEKKDRKRQQDAESKRRQRAAKKALQRDAEVAAQ
ncbi:hypothetical protein [Rhizobium ruizarguesonis]|uniref:hypothetical protein n=1 Tax=Rhizobium ruizarguesonis TaxID=2081791 RepID=UPI0010317800|nr:hypothetical protein [Rhizobium ruizarguesonis]TBA18771.1 hypothetical protein ELH65_23940 [Rhizobium ruizarguesonis]